MDDGQRLAIELACGKLPLLFAKYADNGDVEAMGQLFTPDCEFSRPFQPEDPFYGRNAVEGVFRNRPPILVRHIVTNVLVEAVTETRARGTNYLTMLSSHASTEPPQEAGALYVGGFQDDDLAARHGERPRRSEADDPGADDNAIRLFDHAHIGTVIPGW